jgi:hypothetical protein
VLEMINSPRRSNVKRLAAVIGGSGVIAVGAMSVAVAQQEAAHESVAKSTNMTIGGTSTTTTPGPVPAITMAEPTLKGPAPLPAEEQGPAAP